MTSGFFNIGNNVNPVVSDLSIPASGVVNVVTALKINKPNKQ